MKKVGSIKERNLGNADLSLPLGEWDEYEHTTTTTTTTRIRRIHGNRTSRLAKHKFFVASMSLLVAIGKVFIRLLSS